MEPPEEGALQLAVDMLQTINAIDRDEQLTPLGYHLAQLPLDPQTGKMILLAAIFGCLDPILSVAASLSFKDAFVVPLGKEEVVDRRKCELAKGTRSDHLMLANAIADWEYESGRGRGRQFCWDNFLSESTLRMLANMKRQFAEHLRKTGFLTSGDVKDARANRNSGNEDLVRAVVCAGLYPNVCSVKVKRNKHRGSFPRLSTATERKVDVHPKSVNAKETGFRYPWLVYHLKMKSSSTFIYDCSEVSPMSLIFFGRELRVGRDADLETIAVDGFVKFNCGAETSVVFKDLRRALDEVLDHKVMAPGATDWDPKRREGAILQCIIDLLSIRPEGAGVEEDDFDD